MSNPTPYFLALNGVPFVDRPDAHVAFFWRDPQGMWLPNEGNHLSEVEKVCVQLHDALEERIFGSKAAYWDFIRVAPELLATAGMNSECPLSKNQFLVKLGSASK